MPDLDEKGFSREAADRLAQAMIEHELAEAKKLDVEREKLAFEREVMKMSVRQREMVVAQDEQKFAEWKAGDLFHHVYYFTDPVTEATVERCIAVLDLWDRLCDDCDVSIIFNSPGGDVTAGFALFDHIQMLRRKGHKFTTITEGMAASMAGILLQAGDVRVCGAEAWVLIHRAAFGAVGKSFEIEDRVEWVKRIETRILNIFAERSAQAKENGTATTAMTVAKLRKNWERKDWWLSSDECLKFGVVDEVR